MFALLLFGVTLCVFKRDYLVLHTFQEVVENLISAVISDIELKEGISFSIQDAREGERGEGIISVKAKTDLPKRRGRRF